MRFVLYVSFGDVLCRILLLDEEVKVVIPDDLIVRIHVGLLCGLPSGISPDLSRWSVVRLLVSHLS